MVDESREQILRNWIYKTEDIANQLECQEKCEENPKCIGVFIAMYKIILKRGNSGILSIVFSKSKEQWRNDMDEIGEPVSFFEPFCESGLQVSKLLSAWIKI